MYGGSGRVYVDNAYIVDGGFDLVNGGKSRQNPRYNLEIGQGNIPVGGVVWFVFAIVWKIEQGGGQACLVRAVDDKFRLFNRYAYLTIQR